jgi:threonine/homoserine/homoserine lactone efflux protein
MINYLTAGLVLGVSAGLHPGPLAALVVREAVSRGFAAGARIAFAPLLTDGPIILAAILLLRPLRDNDIVLSMLAVCGAGYCVWLAWTTWRLGARSAAEGQAPPASLREAVLVNMFNPNPYLFWLTVGSAWLTRGGYPEGAAFVAAFMSGIVGTKLGMAWLASHARAVAGRRAPTWIGRLLAVALAIFAVQLLVAAVQSAKA